MVAAVPLTDRPTEVEGWDDPPASGVAFILNSVSVEGKDQGFNVDQNCAPGEACNDNILHPVGTLGNDQIRQGVIGGQSLLLVEFAGLDQPYRGEDESLTLKVYGAKDGDDVLFPTNNFEIPDGHTSCCEFKINPQSIVSPPTQARSRAPARIERGELQSLAPVPIQFTITLAKPPHPEIRFEKVVLKGRLSADLSKLEDGIMGGAVPINTLAQTNNPYCTTPSDARCPALGSLPFDSTLFDLVTNMVSRTADIDLDGDGLECGTDTDSDGIVDLCCDGPGPNQDCLTSRNTCAGRVVPPTDPARPSSCGQSERMKDGYSIAMGFSAVRAKIVGFGL